MDNKKANKLRDFRKGIDKIDGKILKLLANRFFLVKNIMKYKKLNGIKLVDKERENQIIKNIKMKSRRYKTNEKYTENIFKSIIKSGKNCINYLFYFFFWTFFLTIMRTLFL
jgi:chorismate mutase